MKKNSSVNS